MRKRLRKGCCLFAVCAIMLLTYTLEAQAEAATHYVPDNFATIQSAIDGSQTGDTILVRPGTYYENINFNGKSITLKSTDGAENTVIDGGKAGIVVTFVSGEGAGSILEGFTITNGSHYYRIGGIWIQRSSPTIKNCNIVRNDYWGIMIEQYSSPSITNCFIEENGEGGLWIILGSPIITNCVIARNNGKAIQAVYGAPRLRNCTITGNTIVESPYYLQGTIQSSFYAWVTLKNCIVYSNDSELDAYTDPRWPGGITFYDSDMDVSKTSGAVYYAGNTINADPMFVSPENGDYHLAEGSPCIDSATTRWSNEPAFDIEGTPRPQGANYDMGAYEFVEHICEEPPVLEIASFGPDYIWPPDQSVVEIVLTGNLALPEDCMLTGASYSLVDEYGEYTTSGELSVDSAGGFTVAVPAEAWRDGGDKDGRLYGLTISVEDEAGSTTETRQSLVLHDQGK